MAHTEQVQ